MKTVKEMTLTQLREWNTGHKLSDDEIRNMQFTGVIVVPTRKIHDSGWRAYRVIGVQHLIPVAVLSNIADAVTLEKSAADFRLDVLPKSNCAHIWGNAIVSSGSTGISNVELMILERAFNS